MATVLFAWELGGDYGHLARLLPVARELQSRGHTAVFAARDLAGAEALLHPHGIRTYQAPLWIGGVANMPEPVSYAELLMRFGFLSPRGLTGICRAWRNLVELVKPSLIVLDHAPTALLATRGINMARLNFGDGFCIPPTGRPMPHFRWWQRENMARVEDSERHAVANANLVLQALDAPPLVGLSDLQECDATLLCSFAEMDPYPQRSGQDYLGPISALGQGAEMAWPGKEGPRIFAYLKAGYPGLDQVLLALQKSKARVLVHASGIARQTMQNFSSATMAFSADPLNMDQMCADCDLAVCHGGAGTTAAMLLAGKPLVLLPMQMEQTMSARRLAALGVAQVVMPEMSSQVPRIVKQALIDAAMLTAARSFARDHAAHDQLEAILAVAGRCEALMRRTAP